VREPFPPLCGEVGEDSGAHYRRGYDGGLYRILAAEIVEAVYRA